MPAAVAVFWVPGQLAIVLAAKIQVQLNTIESLYV
jgi:hypothetical protein